MNRATLLLCLFGILSSNLISNVAARLGGEGIIGGERADEKQFPYQVALLVKGKLVCGGGIIGDKYILTAAHCFIDKTGSFYNRAYTVVAGATDLNLDEGIKIAPEKVYVHKDYQTSTFENDIAILKLKEGLGVDSNPSLSKLNLPKANLKYTGRTAVISGYGFTTIQVMTYPVIGIPIEVGGSTDNKLRFTKVDIISNAECAQRNALKPVYNSNICGQVKQHNPSKSEGICSGDSGSPLVIDDDVVIGVVSTSPLGCDETVEAASYTRVSSHLTFVENVLKGKSTTGARIFEFPDDKPAQKSSGDFLFFPPYPSYGQDDDIFSIPQYGDRYAQFPSFSLPFDSLGYKKRK
ncbi:serine protease SP24D-like [Nasonia vitripennis]|uniref:Peptidase S1 domain-containing protein n=1 Tax=Nasonia vitripennis TaxID=7425 RepID=A0A7M7M1J1_NASVI|nr:serine protease SP24D-like [Nasonia vitripennis]